MIEKDPDLFGRRFILLPNPMYGEWEGATYNYRYKIPAGAKTKDRTNALQSFDRNGNYETERN